MIITAIKPNQTNDGYSVYIDGAFTFSIDADAVLETKIKAGQEIDAHILELLKQKAENRKHYRRILQYVSLRLRSEGEIRDYGFRKKIPTDAMDQIITKLTALGLIDDEAFARRFVEYKQMVKPLSVKRLKLELRKKHISSDIIDSTLRSDDDDAVNDVQSLRKLIAKLKTRTRYQDEQKLLQYLARQGYRYSDIQTALNDETE